ncbi:MAG: glycoside hydrolase family 99-like domain-containing protein [Phycisphaerales bacterium]|nr:MAG: glycoside hydrolase family 99-like domain-containing protein [Phycisphaerales bacterium]
MAYSGKGLVAALLSVTAVAAGARAMERSRVESAGRRVMAFYYPWYGVPDGPGGAGRVVHWGRIDAAAKDIAASTHYPQLGAYDSHDPKVIERHCRWAKEGGIDTFIVSWWGHGHYTDRAMTAILDGCERSSMSACIYYETVPAPRTPAAAADILRVLGRYGGHPAHLKVKGRPVVFVYGRALQEMGLTEWRKAVGIINERYEGGAVVIGDQFSYGAARVFDGVHTYNTAGMLRGKDRAGVREWAAATYSSWVDLADRAGKISTLTVIPGYDDTKIRKPGLAVDRYEGASYRIQWEEAIRADPHWVLITSFNEWHEGSEVEPSAEYGRKYLELTAGFAREFKASERKARKSLAGSGLSAAEKARLRAKLGRIRMAALPDADSAAFWWLLDLGVGVDVVSWEDVVEEKLSPEKCAVLLYCGGESYRSSVRKAGDVEMALAGYLKAGGTIAFLPSLPWPFYYDENGNAVNRSGRLGLTLRSSWESPPAGAELYLSQPEKYMSHVPERFEFPKSGDLRWRPFVARRGLEHTSLLELRNGGGAYLGDAVAWSEAAGGGHVLYVWFGLLGGPYAETLLYDVFDFLCARVGG